MVPSDRFLIIARILSLSERSADPRHILCGRSFALNWLRNSLLSSLPPSKVDLSATRLPGFLVEEAQGHSSHFSFAIIFGTVVRIKSFIDLWDNILVGIKTL